MKKIEKLGMYVFILISMCIVLGIFDIGCIFFISYYTNNHDAYIDIEKISNELQIDSVGNVNISDIGKEYIEEYSGFAMLINNEGDVIWNYKKPQDVPNSYTLQDVAAFSKWYLNNYPVYTWNIEEGIFVVGQSKNLVWKYNIIYSTATLGAYARYLPILIGINLIVLITVPFIVVKSQMKKRESVRTTWIAGVSHDIRTPLTLVLGHTAMLKKECVDTNILKRVSDIEKKAIRMKTLITNLNMENKLSYGMGKWESEEVKIAAFLRDCICNILNSDLKENYEFDVKIGEDVEENIINVDRELLKRLVENLINNSIEHNQNGCKITVELFSKKENSKKEVILRISDDGIGVSTEQIQRLNKNIRVNKLPEHGLGTRLVKQIAKKYHWKVRFDSIENEYFSCEIYIKPCKIHLENF